jgi:hypothetical protein
VQDEIAFLVRALSRADSGAFLQDVVSDAVENYRFFVFPVSHLYRCTLVTYAAPVALRFIKPHSRATTIANKKFFLHHR